MDVREKLVERLRWWAAECDRTNFGCQARKLLVEAADYIDNGVTVHEWISVKDRLPEKWQNVLVVRTDGAFRLDFVGSLDVWYDDVNFVGYPVTHWMPLPEAPEGDE